MIFSVVLFGLGSLGCLYMMWEQTHGESSGHLRTDHITQVVFGVIAIVLVGFLLKGVL